MNNQHRFEICCHEAGHGVIGHVLGVYKVTVLEVLNDTFGHCIFSPDGFDTATNHYQAEPHLIMTFAGKEAQLKAQLTKWTIAKPPLQPRAKKEKQTSDKFPCPRISLAQTGYARSLEGKSESDLQAEERLADSFFPREVAGPWLYYLTRRTSVMVNEHWPQILAVAGRLFWKSQVWKREFNQIMKGTIKCVP